MKTSVCFSETVVQMYSSKRSVNRLSHLRQAVKIAHLAAKQQTGITPLGRYITSHRPFMANLLGVARAIFGLPGIFKRVGLSMNQFLD